MTYYNEWEKKPAQWIRNLIEEGLIPKGHVDERSIKEITPADLAGYTQCHFFAGYAGWALALRQAGWEDNRPIWTGSCPCQPFSSAGRHRDTADPRHLWPDFCRLIRGGRPAVVMGEQVAGAPGYGWFDGVQSDLAAEGYSSRAVDLPACSVNAPHIRNRLFWAAESRGLDNTARQRRATGTPAPIHSTERQEQPQRRCRSHHGVCRDQQLAHADVAELRDQSPAGQQSEPKRHSSHRHRNPWEDWTLIGPDPKGSYRRVGFAEYGIRGMAHGRSGRRPAMRSAIPLLAHEAERIVRLKAMGNGMVLPLVVEVIRAWM
jgi:site-specific DNA-cytosine methylase